MNIISNKIIELEKYYLKKGKNIIFFMKKRKLCIKDGIIVYKYNITNLEQLYKYNLKFFYSFLRKKYTQYEILLFMYNKNFKFRFNYDIKELIPTIEKQILDDDCPICFELFKTKYELWQCNKCLKLVCYSCYKK